MKENLGLLKKQWWKQTGLGEELQIMDERTNDGSFNEFQLFFHRMVNLSAVRVVPDPFHTWSQIHGDNPCHLAAGYTKSTSPGTIEVKDALKREHDALKVLFFNRDQQALLVTDEFTRAIFFCDFGAGNCKYKICIKRVCCVNNLEIPLFLYIYQL